MATKKNAQKTVKGFIRTLSKGIGVCEIIRKATKKGFTQKELIDAGFNKNTVYRQAALA